MLMQELSRLGKSANKHINFFALEGIDGCGKTTVALQLKKELEELGYNVHLTREPFYIRDILNTGHEFSFHSDVILFASDRLEHVKKEVRPHLYGKRDIVICDRYVTSSIAYQLFGRNHHNNIDKVKFIIDYNDYAIDSIMPIDTFYIDTSLAISKERREGRTGDVIDKVDAEFYERVKYGYDTMSQIDSYNYFTIDGDLTSVDSKVKQIKSKIIERMRNL